MKELKGNDVINIIKKNEPEVVLFSYPADKQKMTDFIKNASQIIVIKEKSWSK